MPYLPPVNEGLLRDVLGHLDNVVPDLPGPFDDAIRRAVETAVAVVDPQAPTPAVPDKPQVLPPDTNPQQRNEVLKALDTAISAIGVVLRFRWLIPDQYERPLELLGKALERVRSWID